MSHFIFKDSDFESPGAFLSASANNVRNKASNEPLKTTRSLSDTTQYLTTYDLADIMQGAALYKPEALALETFNETLSTTYVQYAKLAASNDFAYLNPGREGIAPGLAGQAHRAGALPADSRLALQYGATQAFAAIHPSEVDTVAGFSSSSTDFAPPEFVQYGNGKLPVSALTPLEGEASHHRLWAPAAQGFNLMRQAMIDSGFRGDIAFVQSSYRDYDGQVAAKQKYGKQAATPGRSKHGWGIAIDIARRFYKAGSLEYNDAGQSGLEWMNQNAYRFGFVHPLWARPGGSNPEPWHWEYRAHLQ